MSARVVVVFVVVVAMAVCSFLFRVNASARSALADLSLQQHHLTSFSRTQPFDRLRRYTSKMADSPPDCLSVLLALSGNIRFAEARKKLFENINDEELRGVIESCLRRLPRTGREEITSKLLDMVVTLHPHDAILPVAADKRKEEGETTTAANPGVRLNSGAASGYAPSRPASELENPVSLVCNMQRIHESKSSVSPTGSGNTTKPKDDKKRTAHPTGNSQLHKVPKMSGESARNAADLPSNTASDPQDWLKSQYLHFNTDEEHSELGPVPYRNRLSDQVDVRELKSIAAHAIPRPPPTSADSADIVRMAFRVPNKSKSAIWEPTMNFPAKTRQKIHALIVEDYMCTPDKKATYLRMAQNPQTYTDNGRCLNNMLYHKGSGLPTYTKSNGIVERACDSCINAKRLCARFVRIEGEVLLGIYPLPHKYRSEESWQYLRFWVRSGWGAAF